MWEALLLAVFSVFVYLCLGSHAPSSTPDSVRRIHTSQPIDTCAPPEKKSTKEASSGVKTPEKQGPQASKNQLAQPAAEANGEPVETSPSWDDEPWTRGESKVAPPSNKGRDFHPDTPPHLAGPSTRRGSKGSSKPKWFCKPCSKPFGSDMALQQHRMNAHHLRETVKSSELAVLPAAEELKCDVCELDCASRIAIRRHKSQEHNWALMCTKCLMTFANAPDATSHYHEYHGAPDVLSEGMGAFLDYLKVNFAPVAAATPQRTPECLFCSATFADASELEQHLQDPFAHADQMPNGHFPALPSTVSSKDTPSWTEESAADSSGFTPASEFADLTPDAMQRGPNIAPARQQDFEKWKTTVTARQCVPTPPYLKPIATIEEQLPSFLFSGSDAESAPYIPPSPEVLEPSSSLYDILPELSPMPETVEIAAWSTPLAPRLLVPVPSFLPGSVSAYPDLAAIARRQKDKGKGKIVKKPPTPTLQPIYDDGWTIAQPAIVPARSRGGRVVQNDWGMEAIITAAHDADRRKQSIYAGAEDPYGGW